LLEPGEFDPAEAFDLLPGVGPGDGGTEGDDEDVAQEKLLGAIDPGIGQGGQMTGQGQVGWGGHGGSPEVWAQEK